MPDVTIAGETYTVAPLEGAARSRYIFHIAGLAKDLNPWLELYEKVKLLPPNLQEIAFWRLYHEDLHAVSEAEAYRLGSQRDATRLLVRLMIPGDNPPVVTDENAADIFAELYPPIEKGPVR